MFYAFAKVLFTLLFSLVFRWRIIGAHHVPVGGPVILCANHFSFFDPPAVGCAVGRRVYFMAKEEFFHIPVFKTLLRWLGAFPVKRGQADRAAIRQSLEHLKLNRVVGIFPEGTRQKSGQPGDALPGAAFLAMKAGALVVPVAIIGPYRPFRPFTIRIGNPLRVSELTGGKTGSEGLQQASRRIMETIVSLMELGPADEPENEVVSFWK